MQSLRVVRAAAAPLQRRCFSTAAAAPVVSGQGGRVGAASHPSLSFIKRVGVVGAGQMGQGIGIVTAVHAKLPVHLVDSSSDALKRATDFIAANLRKDVSKGKLSSSDADAALARF